jgi:hypothetical protein
MGGGINGNCCPSAESQQAKTSLIYFLQVIEKIEGSLQIPSPAQDVQVTFAFSRPAKVEDYGDEASTTEVLCQQYIAPVGGVVGNSGNAMADAQTRVGFVSRRNMKLAGQLKSIDLQTNFLCFHLFEDEAL